MDIAFRSILIQVLMAVLLIVAVITLLILIRIVLRLRRDNVFLLKQMESLLSSSHYREMQNILDEAGERMRMHGRVSEMTDDELQGYVEDIFRQKKLYKNPDLTLKEAAMRLGMTQARLKSLFGADSALGYFSDFITDLRLSEACRLLKSDNNYTIEAMAKEAGFSSRKTFQTRFKNKFGMTPSQYRISEANAYESN